MSDPHHGGLAGPGEEYNPGPATTPRQAATVILMRGGDALEVLLVRRSPQARFMGGVWVFPGGAVDAAEGEGDDAHREAEHLCDRLLSYASPLGLYAEELEASSGRHLGNYPQAFTHLALINAVTHVIEAQQRA